MIAVDTNVLVYAVDADASEKGERARALLGGLAAETTVLLWQVACEFGAVVRRKQGRGVLVADAQAALEAWLGIFPLVSPSVGALRSAWALIESRQISYWDAMLLAACLDAGVTTLYTEDAQSASVIEGVALVNPFT